jgi:hypothetical protein
MRKGERRNYSATSLKPQRIDKRFTRRFQQTTIDDLGDKYKITRRSSPHVETSEQVVDKKASKKWLNLYDRNGLWIRKSLVSGDIYAFHKIGKASEYIGKLENIDLWELFKASGLAIEAFREEVNKVVRGRIYRRSVLSLNRAPRELFERSKK